jgi:RNA polymerase sigma-70 factor (ECF subfamily)
MGIPKPSHAVGSRGAGQFTTTHWSVVLGAKQQDSTHAFQALSRLCQTYWYPLYVYVRRQGYDADEAQDLTQEFFARFLQRTPCSQWTRRRGSFARISWRA